MDPAVFPEEMWIKVLLYCSVPDIIAFGSTCKHLRKTADSDYLWKMKWLQLLSKVHFKFPDIKCLQLLSVSFKAMCYRLHMVITLGENVPFPKCYRCSRYTCQKMCMQSSCAKVVIEVGSKYTWVITPNFGLRRHFSMYALPRYNNQSHMEYTEAQEAASSSSSCQKSDVKSLTKKLKSLKIPDTTPPVKIPRPSGPFCVFCNTIKLYREKRRVTLQPDAAYAPLNPVYEDLVNGYCTDTRNVMRIPNVDIVSPAQALHKEGAFPIVRRFVAHMIRQMNLTRTLRKPNAVLMFCEPLGIDPTVRKNLLHYLFQEVKAARVCLVPKPLAACAMLELDTCIVVDSGALTTTVCVVSKGRILPYWRMVPIGGWHLSNRIKQTMSMQSKDNQRIPAAYLDTLTVKEKCRLTPNLKMEEKRNGQRSKEHISLRVDSYADYQQFWKITLGHELYTATEKVYVSLGLPEVIKDVVSSLPEELIYDTLSHILLTGGNTDTAGFEGRLAKDLRELMPEYRHIIDVKSCPGTHSWNVAMGCSYIPLKVHPEKTLPEYIEGSPFWLSREEYVLFGCESFETQEPPESTDTSVHSE